MFILEHQCIWVESLLSSTIVVMTIQLSRTLWWPTPGQGDIGVGQASHEGQASLWLPGPQLTLRPGSCSLTRQCVPVPRRNSLHVENVWVLQYFLREQWNDFDLMSSQKGFPSYARPLTFSAHSEDVKILAIWLEQHSNPPFWRACENSRNFEHAQNCPKRREWWETCRGTRIWN